jgi:radical SAM protein with 4Fe4S-binding SPASM domain
VIIPTWNGSKYLGESFESITHQEDDRIEVIVIDDGSTDSTVDILEGYAQRLPIRIVKREHIGNWIKNTNLGISMASGEYVSFLHQDDVWLPDRLKCLREMTGQHPDVNFFFHPSYFIDDQGEQVGIWKCPLPQNQTPLSPSLILPRLLVQNFISVSAVCFKRSVTEQVGFLDDLLWYTADWKFWIDLVSQGKSIYYPHPLSSFRIHSLSLSFRSSVDLRDLRDQMQRVLEQCLPLINTSHNHSPFIVKQARFSIKVNTALAGLAQGELSGIKHLFREGIPLNPVVWASYIRYSGIFERCGARIRAGLLHLRPNDTKRRTVNRLRATTHRIKLLMSYLKKGVICPGLPPNVIISSTSRCNLRCPMCIRTILKFDNKDIAFDLFRKIIDEGVPYFEFVILYGAGEPLMNPKIFDMVRYCKVNGLNVSFSTNATLLKGVATEQVFESGLDDIILAFDGATPHAYETCRKGARFSDTRDNIIDFLERKSELHSDIVVTVQMVRLPNNHTQIFDFIKLWNIKGVNSVRIKEDEVSVDGFCLDQGKSSPKNQNPCHILWQGPIYIEENGDVYPCCYMRRSSMPVGNIQDAPLKDIWNNDRMRKLRQAHVTGNGHIYPECSNCRAVKPRLPLIIGSFLLNSSMVRRIVPVVERLSLFYRIPFFKGMRR